MRAVPQQSPDILLGRCLRRIRARRTSHSHRDSHRTSRLPAGGSSETIPLDTCRCNIFPQRHPCTPHCPPIPRHSFWRQSSQTTVCPRLQGVCVDRCDHRWPIGTPASCRDSGGRDPDKPYRGGGSQAHREDQGEAQPGRQRSLHGPPLRVPGCSRRALDEARSARVPPWRSWLARRTRRMYLRVTERVTIQRTTLVAPMAFWAVQEIASGPSQTAEPSKTGIRRVRDAGRNGRADGAGPTLRVALWGYSPTRDDLLVLAFQMPERVLRFACRRPHCGRRPAPAGAPGPAGSNLPGPCLHAPRPQ